MQGLDANANAWDAQKARLQEALRRDEFELYLQPIVALEHPRDWHMAEVLIRLRQEERALLPPGEFLPAFELFGMLPLLDCWVLRKVAQRQATSAARFAINVSGQTLEHEGFLRLLNDLAVRRGSLLFEIEESDIVLRPHAAQRFCEAVRAAGGAIVVDGFGRRALSFASFAHLQPEFVKIDGSLTRTMASDESCVLRVQTIRRLGEALGAGLIAECVETQDVLLQLDSLGVGYAQGWGVCRPQPMDELLAREPQLAAA
jgi:EAL domain-containing protein (putative c-di-GMP-specific phosphodiesterase class I)